MKPFFSKRWKKIILLLIWLGVAMTSLSPKFQITNSTPNRAKAVESTRRILSEGIQHLSKPLVFLMPIMHSPDEQSMNHTPQQLRRSGRVSKRLNFENRQEIIAQEMGVDHNSDPDYEDDAESSHYQKKRGTPIPKNPSIKGTPIPTPHKAMTNRTPHSTLTKKTKKFLKEAQKTKWRIKTPMKKISTTPRTPRDRDARDDRITISRRDLEKLVDDRVAAKSTKNAFISFNYEQFHGVATKIAMTKPGYKTLARTDDEDCFAPRIFDPIGRKFEELKKISGRNNRLLDLGLEHAKLTPSYVDTHLERARGKCLMEDIPEEITVGRDDIIMVRSALGAWADSIMLQQEIHAHREENPATTCEELRKDYQVLHETVAVDKRAWKSVALVFSNDIINQELRTETVGKFVSRFARMGARAQGCDLGAADFELAGDAPLEKFQPSKPARRKNGSGGGKWGKKGKNETNFQRS